MNWLENIRPPKYLRYFFYASYNWYTPYSSEKESAHYTAAIFLTIPHMILILIVINLFFATALYETYNKSLVVAIVALPVMTTHFFLFIYKSKWKKYLKEFKHLTTKDRRKGTLFLFGYFFVILVILFPLSFFKVISDSPYYK